MTRSPDPSTTDTTPGWVQWVDVACLLLLAAAVVVSLSGGFRVRVYGVRIAVTSGLPLVLWALAVAALRQYFWRAKPVYREIPARVAGWSRSPGVRTSVAALVGTRPAIFLVGYLAVLMIGYEGGRAPIRSSNNELENLPVRWDAGWYLDIVQSGYRIRGESASGQQNIVFFPAFPMLVRAAGRLLGGSLGSYVLAGVLVSLLAFGGALVYVYALARDSLSEEETRFALWLIAAYPFAFFFGAIYTESLYLLGAAAAFYHFSRRQYLWAALWGALVGLTRPNGFLLVVPLMLLAWTPRLPSIARALPTVGPAQPAHSAAASTAVAFAPVAGLAAFSAYVWHLTGDPLLWQEGHLAWGRQYKGLAVVVTDRYDVIANLGLRSYVEMAPTDVLNALGVIFVLVAVWPVVRRFGLAYGAFILVNILPPLAAGGLLSAGRFSSVLFPAFMWLASVVPARQRGGWVASFAAIQAFNAALFYTWRQMY